MTTVRMTYKLEGPWDEVGRFFKNPARIKAVFHQRARRHMWLIGNKMMKKFRLTILSQGSNLGLSWPPLSPATVSMKGHSKMLLETWELARSFMMWRVSPDVFNVGLGPETHIGSTSGGKGLTKGELGKILEFGTPMSANHAFIPARPFFGPTVDAYILVLAQDHAPVLMREVISILMGSRGLAFGLAGNVVTFSTLK